MRRRENEVWTPSYIGSVPYGCRADNGVHPATAGQSRRPDGRYPKAHPDRHADDCQERRTPQRTSNGSEGHRDQAAGPDRCFAARWQRPALEELTWLAALHLIPSSNVKSDTMRAARLDP